jgi:hypothetical protein
MAVSKDARVVPPTASIAPPTAHLPAADWEVPTTQPAQ